VGAATIVFLSRRVLIAQGEQEVAQMSLASVAGLSAAVAVSIPSHFIFALGNVAMFISICMLLALLAQARNRPALAGVLLALSSIKINTMLPMLMLFLRRRDLRTWMWLLAAGLFLCLIVPGPVMLIEWTRTNLHNIMQLAVQGATNDYSIEGPHFHTILGTDMIVHHLGVGDRDLVRVLQMALLGVLGGFIFWNVVVRQRWSRGMSSSVVALYSMIFLYHRTHDSVLLALPLVYAAARFEAAREPAVRKRFLLAMLAILTIMFVHPRLSVVLLGALELDGVAARVAQAVVYPYATWLVLLALLLLVRGDALASRGETTEIAPVGNN
jgi:hypothetical protein